MKSKSKSGWSLIELLAVICIIAVVAVIYVAQIKTQSKDALQNIAKIQESTSITEQAADGDLEGALARLKAKRERDREPNVKIPAILEEEVAKLYTKTGDDGKTYMKVTGKASKASLAAEAVGSVDELNCHIGLIRESGYGMFRDSKPVLKKVQNELFALGAQLSTGDPSYIVASHVDFLEREIDRVDENLPELKNFILPYDPAQVHLARAVCRRAERDVVSFRDSGTGGDPENFKYPIQYLNRLSDYLFASARTFSSEETIWEK